MKPITNIDDYVNDNIKSSWLLTSTPIPVLIIVSLYLVFVLKLGPQFMEKRQPFKLKGIMMIYNIFQVVYNSILVGWLLMDADGIKYLINHSCHPVDPRFNPLNYVFSLASWAYLLAKIVDLTDTIFIVLRKKNSHITVLHVYHHTAMVLCTWYSVKYIRAEQGIIPGFLNSFVHVIMYAYYFLASLGPEIQKYLWWKRYLTKIQITQFFIILGFLFTLLYNNCEVSHAYNVLWISNVFVILVLFSNFYIRTYILKVTKVNEPNTKKAE